MAEFQILTDTQAEGSEFSVSGIYSEIVLSKHSGGTWTLQRKTPDDEWIDTNVSFTGNDVKSFVGMPGVVYRVEGGTTGATAWVTSNEEGLR